MGLHRSAASWARQPRSRTPWLRRARPRRRVLDPPPAGPRTLPGRRELPPATKANRGGPKPSGMSPAELRTGHSRALMAGTPIPIPPACVAHEGPLCGVRPLYAAPRRPWVPQRAHAVVGGLSAFDGHLASLSAAQGLSGVVGRCGLWRRSPMVPLSSPSPAAVGRSPWRSSRFPHGGFGCLSPATTAGEAMSPWRIRFRHAGSCSGALGAGAGLWCLSDCRGPPLRIRPVCERASPGLRFAYSPQLVPTPSCHPQSAQCQDTPSPPIDVLASRADVGGPMLSQVPLDRGAAWHGLAELAGEERRR